MNRKESNPHKKSFEEIYRRHSIPTTSGIRDAMRKINALSGESMTLFAVDADGLMQGTVTDGDIRRALVNGLSLEAKVSEVMHRKFLYASPGDNISEILVKGRKRHIDLLPILKEGKIIDFIDLNITKSFIPVEAVLMAGGRGERLRPLTDNLPKPLLPVGGKPIIDYNIDDLEACGVRSIYVTVNYLAEMIEDHFKKREGLSEVTCIKEPKRMGTLGSLSLIEGIKSEDILVMNSDLLMDIDFQDMYLHHRNKDADLTIAAVPYNVSVPFAIMRMDDDWVEALEEKPTYNYFANGGVYMMKRSLIEKIPKGSYVDAPDFISSLIEQGGKVTCHHLEGSWIDIGSPDDYRLARELMSRRNKK